MTSLLFVVLWYLLRCCGDGLPLNLTQISEEHMQLTAEQCISYLQEGFWVLVCI